MEAQSLTRVGFFLLGLLLLAGALRAQPRAAPGDKDSDGDGLSDFQERHKYGTDPAKADSDGDGVPDGDWDERREYSYTIRSVIQVMPRYDEIGFSDDYQDGRVLYECPEYVELEVIHYPLNTCAEAIVSDPAWRRTARRMEEYLRPGTTTNWNRAMQEDLKRRLRRAGIDVAKLTDREVVERVSEWALEHAKSTGKTCVWGVVFEAGRPKVPSVFTEKIAAAKAGNAWTDEELFEHELYGRGMYENRTRGTCTTSANYLATVLRAVGIPTRCIVTIPVVDASDSRNLEMVENRITHHAVRRDLLRGLRPLKDSFAAHTYNEVWVGGRWRRLNYSRLGQNTLDPGFMGLMTRVHTFLDIADAGLGSGWGLGRRTPSDVFRHANPYTALTLSDRFGEHADVENPKVEGGPPTTLTITKAYWFASKRDRPRNIGADWHGARDRRQGHLLIHVKERGISHADLHEKVTKDFVLLGKKGEEIPVRSLHAIWPERTGDGAEFYLRIPAEGYARMKRGRRYTLAPVAQHERFRWVCDGISVTR